MNNYYVNIYYNNMNNSLTDIPALEDFEYFHNLDNGYDINSVSSFLDDNIPDTEKLKYNNILINSSLYLNVFGCNLCNVDNTEYKITFGKEINLGFCPYYENAAKIIQNRFKWNKNLPTLWKIAEYYTKQKYSPNSIMKYIKLDD